METGPIRRILITRTDRLGDVVLSTPVIRFMREQYPSAYIAFMVKPYCEDVVKHNPHLDEVIVYKKYRWHKSYWGTFKFAMGLRMRKFDMAIALHPTNRVHIMLLLAGIPIRIGYDRKAGALLTKRVPHEKHKGHKHEIDYNFDLLARAGFDVSNADPRPYIVTKNKQKRIVDLILKYQGVGGQLIAVHAGASCVSKRWPPERFAQVCDMLVSKFGYDIILVGGSEAMSYSYEVLAHMKSKAVNLTGALRVGELAELFKRCRMLISNDSGPVHVSAAVGTPVVCVFGRSDAGLSPLRWRPHGEEHVVIHRDVGCLECLAHNCMKNFECLWTVSVEEVASAAEKILCGSLK